jgi:hypothetical protein
MDEQRRMALGVGAVIAAVASLPACTTIQQAGPMQFEPMPTLPVTPTPGRRGDFDFLTGEWLDYEGEATVYGILAGIGIGSGSVEELRIPSRGFAGMGLRLLDVEKGVWSDFWVNARSGVLTTPGQTGSFENGAGIFVTDAVENGKSVKYAGVWDDITPASCRWRQEASSRDGGQTWEQNWIMNWTKVR